MRMSNLFQRRGEVDVALEYGILSLKISEEFDNVFRLASSYQNIAGVYLRKSNYLKSSEFYNKALNNYNLLEDDKGISIVNHNSALMLMQYGDFKLAKTRFLKASQKFYEFGWFDSYTTALNNVGLINYNLGKYYDSIDSLNKSLKQFEELGNKWGQALSSNTIISLAYTGIGDFDKSIFYANKALKINQETNAGGSSRMYNYISLADNSFLLGDYDVSLQSCELALETLKSKQPWAEHFTYNIIANNKMMLGEHEEALKYYSQSLKIVDELKLLPNRKLHILIAKTLAAKKVGRNINLEKKEINSMLRQVDFLDYLDFYNLFQIFESEGISYLVSSKELIDSMIEKLDEDSRNKFMNTPIFIEINKSFKNVL